MGYIEALVDEHRTMGGVGSRLKTLVPSVSHFLASCLKEALIYDEKYAVTQSIDPTFNEIRHILNLSQLIAIGTNNLCLSMEIRHCTVMEVQKKSG